MVKKILSHFCIAAACLCSVYFFSTTSYSADSTALGAPPIAQKTQTNLRQSDWVKYGTQAGALNQNTNCAASPNNQLIYKLTLNTENTAVTTSFPYDIGFDIWSGYYLIYMNTPNDWINRAAVRDIQCQRAFPQITWQ